MGKNMKTLIVDDEKIVIDGLRKFLIKLGHEVTWASNGADALKAFHDDQFDLVITDIKMPDLDGLELLRRIKKVEKAPTDVVIITGFGDMDNTLKALKYGAYDYLQKPVDVRELAIIIERCREYRQIRKKYKKLKLHVDGKIKKEVNACHLMVDHFREIYFDELGIDRIMVFSEIMRNVMKQVDQFSLNRHMNVLVEGESGTGKDLIATYIHYMSSDARKQPFVAINCSALPKHLVEAELFGYEDGAYTNSKKGGSIGKIELADRGTVFLDEIGEMPIEMQSKLLRLVEDGRFFKIGGTEEKSVQARFIFATNKDLREEVDRGNFRLDLYYRVNVGSIRIPPLRKRKEDIIPLAKHFAQRFFPRAGNSFFGFSPKAERFLLEHEWPGNVRELKNLMERLSFSVFGQKIALKDLLGFVGEKVVADERRSTCPPVLKIDEFELPSADFSLASLNREVIRKAIIKFNGNKTEAARYLGVSRRTLYTKLKKYALK